MSQVTQKARDLVIGRIEAYCVDAELSEREFGIKAVGDHKFVPRLRKGYGVTLTLIERAEHFMDGRGEDAEAA